MEPKGGGWDNVQSILVSHLYCSQSWLRQASSSCRPQLTQSVHPDMSLLDAHNFSGETSTSSTGMVGHNGSRKCLMASADTPSFPKVLGRAGWQPCPAVFCNALQSQNCTEGVYETNQVSSQCCHPNTDILMYLLFVHVPSQISVPDCEGQDSSTTQWYEVFGEPQHVCPSSISSDKLARNDMGRTRYVSLPFPWKSTMYLSQVDIGLVFENILQKTVGKLVGIPDLCSRSDSLRLTAS